ncbi:hypothetical protein [Caldalkalibacillus salinus]|uniref:hypothetical protein n=1 Tax=Caldalkalibacillus salinus TaxID=2803787 RepID=UPI0019204D0A|nr:hypothetical protein [Caldalkalibacillus salinus]
MSPMWLLLALLALLIPGVRRFIFYRVIRSPRIRNMGLRFVLSMPYVRDRLMRQVFPKRDSNPTP